MPKIEHAVFVFLIAAITFAVYCDSLNNSFVYDDYPFLVDNPAVRQLTGASVLSNFTGWRNTAAYENLARDVWRPLVTTSFAIDYRLWKLDSRYYHAENLLIHTVNAALVYAATVLILGSPFTAFITAVVFAVHPAQTEAVTWISGRSNVLFLLFFMPAFIAHIRNRRAGGTGAEYPLALIFFFFSLLAKETAIVLPVLCVLYDIHFTGRKKAAEYAAYYMPFFLIAVFYMAARFSVLGTLAQKGGWWGDSIVANIFITLKAIAGYVNVAVFPVNLRVEYPAGELAAAFGPGTLQAAATLSIVIAFYVFFRRKKEVSFYMAWFFAALLPVCNIVPIKAIIAERFLYLPLAGFAALFGMLFGGLDRSPARGAVKAVLTASLTFIIVAYGAISVMRNMDWRDEMSFYMNEAARPDATPKAHYNLGYICAKEAAKSSGNRELAGMYYAMAISEYGKTISLKPDSAIAYQGLGNALSSIGMYDQAAMNFRKALAFEKSADTYNNLGVAYYRGGRTDDAGKCFMRSLALDPHHVDAMINMGNVYSARGETAKAKNMWLRASSLGGAGRYVAGRLEEMESKGP